MYTTAVEREKYFWSYDEMKRKVLFWLYKERVILFFVEK